MAFVQIRDRLRAGKRRLIKDAGSKALFSMERYMARESLVGNEPVLDPGLFPWVPRVEAEWEAIRDEAAAVLENHQQLPNFQDISVDQRSITQDDGWKTFFLYGFGQRSERNALQCPVSTRVVESIPGMTTAFFSILAPGKRIPEHRGLFKGFIRYHLGLIIPEPRDRCGIKIAGEDHQWEPGKSLVFDDTYPHEAWNETDAPRAVLFVDVRRPLTRTAEWLNRGAIRLITMSPYVQDGLKNEQAWEDTYHSVESAMTEHSEP